jgi:hypothetical protein
MSPSEFPEDVDTYLAQLERELHPLPAGERAKIVQEIGGHLAERADVGPQMLHATISQLGTPRALARSFIDDRALSEALNTGKAFGILWAILKGAVRSLAWLTVGTTGVLLYMFAAAFLIMAVLKPVMPERVGMWANSYSDGFINFGVMGGPIQKGPELLGWWIIPICLAAAVALWLAAGWVLKRGGRLLLRKPA